MLKRRIACGLLILAAAVLYLFSNESVTLALLLALILIPLASVGLLRLSGKNLSISLTEDTSDPERKKVRLILDNPDILPVAAADTEVRCVNLRTGEADSSVFSRGIPPRSKRESQMEIIPGHAGRYEVAVASATISDPLGIWQRELSCSDRMRLTVLPELFEMQMTYGSSAAMLENDRYRDNARGNDPGDITGIREYVPGDPVRNIHWKLSEKTDKLLVKELGKPITEQFLVILDTASDIAQDPFELDASAAVFTSLLHSLHRDGIVFSAAWTDPITGKAVIRTIHDELDIAAACDEFLAVPASAPSAFGRIERDIAESRYAHIIIVSSRIPDGVEAITNGCQVTVLLQGGDAAVTENNLSIIGFESKTYITDLAGIEV